MFDYMKILNAHAFNQMALPVDFPDHHLMVGECEDRTPQSVLIAQDRVPKDVVQNLNHMDGNIDATTEDIINDGIFDEEEFQVSDLLGV